jgi:hypothetical protein
MLITPIPHDEQERRLVKVVEKCYQERGAAEYRILYPHGSGVFDDDQKKLLAARELARENYDNALAELKAYRENLSPLRP